MDDQQPPSGRQDDESPCYFPDLTLHLLDNQPPSNVPFAGDVNNPDSLGCTADEPEVNQYLTRAHRRKYSPAEKLGYLVLAVAEGDRETCRRYGLPRPTLEGWLAEVGGLTAVREFLTQRAHHDFLEAERSLYALVKRQADAGKTPMVELYQTLRALINARVLVPAQQAAIQPAVAAAQATVTVKIADGKVIDLGPPPEEV